MTKAHEDQNKPEPTEVEQAPKVGLPIRANAIKDRGLPGLTPHAIKDPGLPGAPKE
ncbi:MAG TPA: hypothetical protein VGD59_00710 [Acidisarcina sp.]